MPGSLLHGQCTAKDTVTGAVVDTTQAGVPGSITLAGRKPLRTDAAGVFKLTCVPAGALKLVAGAPGFAETTLSIVKRAGLAANVTVVLAVAGVAENVEVNGDDASTAGGASLATTDMDRRQIDALPDDPDQFQAQLRALAATGGGPEDVLITVDGFQGSSTVPPKSAIDRIKINPNPFSSEYATVLWPGGRIEIFTKPGAAAVHGSIFANGSTRVLNATDPFSTAAAPAGNQRFGFDLSGPVAAKTSFFLALEKRTVDEQSVTDATILGANGRPAPLASTAAAQQRLWVGSARLDRQMTASNVAALSFGANVNDADNQGVGGLTLQEAGYGLGNHQYILRASDTEQFTPRLSQETRIGYTWNGITQTPNSVAPSVAVPGFFLGGGSVAGRLQRRDGQLELDDALEYIHGAVTLRFGTQALGTFVRDTVPYAFNGAYLFGGGTAPVLDTAGQPTAGMGSIDALEQYRRAQLGLAGGNATSYQQTSGTVAVPFDQWRQAFFIQGTTRFAHRVTLETGLRYQFQTEPRTWNNFAPRAGISWAIDAKAKWVVQANTGIFTQALDPISARETERLNGVRQQQLTLYSAQYGNPLSPLSSGVQVSATNVFSPTIHQPDYIETLIGIDHTLGRGWKIAALTDFGESWGGLRLRNVNAPFATSGTGPVQVIDAVQAPRPFGPGRNIFSSTKLPAT